MFLASFLMACIAAGCSDDESGFKILEDKIVYSDGCVINYSPRDIKDLPSFLHVENWNSTQDEKNGIFGNYIWTGILDGNRYYASNSMVCSQVYGFLYTENGESFQTDDFENWTDVEVIYIDPAYLKICQEKKLSLIISVPRSNSQAK